LKNGISQARAQDMPLAHESSGILLTSQKVMLGARPAAGPVYSLSVSTISAIGNTITAAQEDVAGPSAFGPAANAAPLSTCNVMHGMSRGWSRSRSQHRHHWPSAPCQRRRNNLLGRISRKANQIDARATGKQRGARNCHNRPDLALARRDRGDDRLRDVRPAGHKLK